MRRATFADLARPLLAALCLLTLVVGPGRLAPPAGAETEDADALSVGEEFVFGYEPQGPVPAGFRRVATLPPVAGIEIAFEDQRATTDESGVVLFRSDARSDISSELRMVDEEVRRDDFGVRARFNRFYNAGRGDTVLALHVERPVTFAFFDLQGNRIAPESIESLRIKNNIGAVVDQASISGVNWLQASRVVSTPVGPEVRPILWSVDEVLVQDTNVVNRAQLRFFPVEVDHVDIDLLFYSARFRSRDAFFGRVAGERIRLTDPTGRVTHYDLDASGEVLVEGLPRGDYQVVVEGPGLPLGRPVALSRDQEVNLALLTWLDLGVVALAGLLFVSTPLAIRYARRRRRDPAGGDDRSSRSAPVAVTPPEDRPEPDRARWTAVGVPAGLRAERAGAELETVGTGGSARGGGSIE